MSAEDKKRLRHNTRLAQQLGADAETSYGEDVAFQIAEFARLSGVSKVVVGRYNIQRRRLLGKPTLTEKLIGYAPNLDIYIIPDQQPKADYHLQKAKKASSPVQPQDVIISLLYLAGATAIGFF